MECLLPGAPTGSRVVILPRPPNLSTRLPERRVPPAHRSSQWAMCRADVPPTTRTRFHSVLEQGGALPLVQQAAEQQLSVQGRLQSPPPAVTRSPRTEKFNKDFLYRRLGFTSTCQAHQLNSNGVTEEAAPCDRSDLEKNHFTDTCYCLRRHTWLVPHRQGNEKRPS